MKESFSKCFIVRIIFLPQISSTRYSMEGVPSLYMSTSMSLSFSEFKGSETR